MFLVTKIRFYATTKININVATNVAIDEAMNIVVDATTSISIDAASNLRVDGHWSQLTIYQLLDHIFAIHGFRILTFGFDCINKDDFNCKMMLQIRVVLAIASIRTNLMNGNVIIRWIYLSCLKRFHCRNWLEWCVTFLMYWKK